MVCLKTGDQVPADARVLEGSVEVNESLLTGESDESSKNVGDELSGSFVTSGEANCPDHPCRKGQLSITDHQWGQKRFKRLDSELKNSLNTILKVISIIIVPIGRCCFTSGTILLEIHLRILS